MVGVFGGFLQLSARLIEQLFCLLRMSAEVKFIFLLRYLNFFKRRDDVLLRFGKVGMPARIDVCGRSLRENHPSEHARNCEHESNIKALTFHFLTPSA